jgi:hypothetical protein
VYIEKYLSAKLGDGGRNSIAFEAKFNVASQEVLIRGGTDRAPNTIRCRYRSNILHLAKGTVRRHNSLSHVLQDRRTDSSKLGGDSGARSRRPGRS